MPFLGVDLGTTGVRALVITNEGQVLGAATAEHPLQSPEPGWMEQEPTDWWEAAGTAIRRAAALSGITAAQVEAIAVSGQMHGVTLLDAQSRVVRPCMLWNDQRSAAQCASITQKVGKERLLQLTGNVALAGFTAPKVLWVREHEPENWTRVRHVLLPHDYLNYRLTGVMATEPSDAAGTLLFDVRARCWSQDMLDALDLDRALFPPIMQSAGRIGVISEEAAAHTGLRAGTPVMGGGADNACAATGCGVLQPGQALCSVGTSGTIVAPVGLETSSPGHNVHLFCHASPNSNYLMGVVLSAGGALRWFRDAFAPDLVATAAAEGKDAYDMLSTEAAATPVGAEGLFFLPYLTGERTPHGSADARGVFFGLQARHTRGHLTCAVIEGVGYALRQCLDLLRGAGVAAERVRITGGGARSLFWRSMLADMFDCQIVAQTQEEGPAFGAALLAAVGAGAFPNIEATGRLITEGETTDPRPANAAYYARGATIYAELYEALAPLYLARRALDS